MPYRVVVKRVYRAHNTHTIEQVTALYRVISVLIETNRLLQQHARLVSNATALMRGALTGLRRQLDTLDQVGNFRRASEQDDKEDQ